MANYNQTHNQKKPQLSLSANYKVCISLCLFMFFTVKKLEKQK